MAQRILGMGDVLTLIEKVEAEYDKDAAAKAQEALLEGQFTLEDFLDQLQQVKRMGPLNNLLGMLPGVPKEVRNAEIGDGEVARIEAIIRSMTPEERRKPDVINGSRRTRIANGSGTSVSEVNLLLKQFGEMAKMMKRFGGMAKAGRKSKKKGRGRVTTPSLPSTKDLRELQKSGPAGLDELLGVRRDKQWP
jgi:signal recognition particle subunit SRP54